MWKMAASSATAGSAAPRSQSMPHARASEQTRAPLPHSHLVDRLFKRNSSSLSLASAWVAAPSSLEQKRLHMVMEDELLAQLHRDQQPRPFQLQDILPLISEGAAVVVEDDFHKCFASNPPEPWNWNAYLYVLWCAGVFWRYCVLFPIRLVSLLLGMLICFAAFFGGSPFVQQPGQWKRKCIRFLASVFVFSWTGVVKYHGVVPKRKPNQIYVANHTSMIDVIVLMQLRTFAAVGQQHKGWVAWFQNEFLQCIGCIWFNRGEATDRAKAAARIQAHISDAQSNRLLIFPEGTCVNNEYCVLFKKGVFELGAEVCPIAIKYNKGFVDAFWDSKRPFHLHLFDLMTSWALVADVWFLEPQTQQPGETAIGFASRVKSLIAQQAGLKQVEWDGLMKHWTGPSVRFLRKRQEAIAKSLKQAFDEAGDVPNATIDDEDDDDDGGGATASFLRSRRHCAASASRSAAS